MPASIFARFFPSFVKYIISLVRATDRSAVKSPNNYVTSSFFDWLIMPANGNVNIEECDIRIA